MAPGRGDLCLPAGKLCAFCQPWGRVAPGVSLPAPLPSPSRPGVLQIPSDPLITRQVCLLPWGVISLPEVLSMAQLGPTPPVSVGQGPGGGQGRGERDMPWASSQVSCPQPLLGLDRMSDWLEGAAGHATPSGGAIVGDTKDGARQGRGRPRRGQRNRERTQAGWPAPGWREPAHLFLLWPQLQSRDLVYHFPGRRGGQLLTAPLPRNLWLECFKQLWFRADLLLC